MPTSHAADDETGFWQRLLYRWFVEYNPLYLVSATLVLGGSILWSNGLAQRDGLAGPLGIALVAELYAASLVAGAALLTRIGMRRPAVMLALLFVLYQWDSTLHTETCAYLGWAGACATLAWVVVFGVKLFALKWALRLRFDRRLVVAAFVAAVGLALGPRLVPGLGGRGAGALVAVWAFALGALYRPGGIASAVELDRWGQTVLRRATLAASALSGVLVGLHVLVWWRDHDLDPYPVVLAVPLLVSLRMQREARAWAMVVGALVVAGTLRPDAFAVTSLLAAVALSVRALSGLKSPTVTADEREADGRGAGPYRTDVAAAPGEWQAHGRTPWPAHVLSAVSEAERHRLLVGALFAAYVSAWTVFWSHGPWPVHVVGLDLALGVVVALFCWRSRRRLALLPLAACYGHLVVERHLVPAPSTAVGWGEASVALGFALLAASLLASYRLRGGPVSVSPLTGAETGS